MSNFEKITATPEALGAFLASLPVATGPWDESFHEKFCASCEREECDTEHCPHQNERNNPTWWLTQAAEGEPVERRYVWRNGRLNIEPGAVQTEQKLIVVRDGYETVLNGFLERMKDEREKRVEKTGDPGRDRAGQEVPRPPGRHGAEIPGPAGIGGPGAQPGRHGPQYPAGV